MQKTLFLCEAERSLLSQKAKCEYTHLVDNSNKFFFGMVKKNARRNHISAVRKEDGSLTESYQEVTDAFVRFYKNLLGSKDQCDDVDGAVVEQGPVLGEEQSSALVMDITETERKNSLHSIGNDKSPGAIYSFHSHFYKKAWPVVGNSVIAAVRKSVVARSVVHVSAY